MKEKQPKKTLFVDERGKRIIYTTDARLKLTKYAADTQQTPAQQFKIATLTGYAFKWGTLSSDRGGYKVRLLPGSASFTPTVHALWHHDFSKPLAVNTNGTLRFSLDDVGCKVEIDLPDTTTGNDAEELIEIGTVSGMSFAMTEAPEAEEVEENGQTILNVKAFTCDEVTITAIPAFIETNIEVAEDDEPEEGEDADEEDYDEEESSDEGYDDDFELADKKNADPMKELDRHRMKLEEYRLSMYRL